MLNPEEVEYLVKNGFVKDTVDPDHYAVITALDQAKGKGTKSNRYPNTKYAVKISDLLAGSSSFGDIYAGYGIKVTKNVIGGVPYYTLEKLEKSYSDVIFLDGNQGVDATAVAGRFDLPYKSISAAMTAAAGLFASSTTRPLVYIRKGTYTGHLDLKNYVDVYCEPGVVFYGSGNIRDNGVAVIANFFGYAKFVSKTSQALSVTGNSTITFEFDSISNTSGQTLRFDPPIGGACNVVVNGNSIYGTTSGVGYSNTFRKKANVVMNIKNYIKAPHSIFDVRDYEGVSIINCPKIIVENLNYYGGNYKQAVIVYSSTAGAKFTVNGNLYDETTPYLAGLSTSIYVGGSGTVEVNGNIYAGLSYGVFAATGKCVVKGDIYSETLPVYAATTVECYISRGVISKPSSTVNPTVRVTNSAKLFLNGVSLYNQLTDSNNIAVDAATAELKIYNCVAQAEGAAGTFIVSAAPTNVMLHGVIANKPLDANTTDLLVPSGFASDVLFVAPKF